MEWLILIPVVALAVAYHYRKKREFWLMQRKWAREDREARCKQDQRDMEEGLRILREGRDE